MQPIFIRHPFFRKNASLAHAPDTSPMDWQMTLICMSIFSGVVILACLIWRCCRYTDPLANPSLEDTNNSRVFPFMGRRWSNHGSSQSEYSERTLRVSERVELPSAEAEPHYYRHVNS